METAFFFVNKEQCLIFWIIDTEDSNSCCQRMLGIMGQWIGGVKRKRIIRFVPTSFNSSVNGVQHGWLAR